MSRCRSKAKANRSTVHPGKLFLFKEKVRAALGGIQTHDTVQSRRALYIPTELHVPGQLTAGRDSNLQHNTTQRQTLIIGYVYICTVAQSGKVYEQSVGSWVEMFTKKWKSTVFYCMSLYTLTWIYCTFELSSERILIPKVNSSVLLGSDCVILRHINQHARI